VSTFRWTNPSLAVEQVNLLVERVALEVMSTAKTLAPYDTGSLQSSITSAQVQADASKCVWTVGTNITYAGFQEFGTYKMPAHPYMGPALAAAAAKYG